MFLDLTIGGFALVPGPVAPPAPTWSSVDDSGQIVEYGAEVVAEAILSVSGARLINDGRDDWWTWRAQWVLDDGVVAVGFSLFDDPAGCWGGSSLDGRVHARTLVRAWRHVRARLPGVWLHDAATTIYTPEGFEARFLEDA